MEVSIAAGLVSVQTAPHQTEAVAGSLSTQEQGKVRGERGDLAVIDI